MENCKSGIISSFLLAIAIILAGYFIMDGIKYFRNFSRSVEVKGLAETQVKSDLATWNINFTVSGSNLKELYQELSTNQKGIIDFLERNGFSGQEIQLGSVSVTDNWANQYSNANAKLPHYQLYNSISLTSKNVDLIAKTNSLAGELVNQGIIITSNNISYFYTNLNSIKTEMLNNATQNAKLAANTFAKNATSGLGKIKSASQGVFTISSPDGSIINDTSSLYKKVRVVTSIQFFLN